MFVLVYVVGSGLGMFHSSLQHGYQNGCSIVFNACFIRCVGFFIVF